MTANLEVVNGQQGPVLEKQRAIIIREIPDHGYVDIPNVKIGGCQQHDGASLCKQITDKQSYV